MIDDAALRDLARLDAGAAATRGVRSRSRGERETSTASLGELAAIARIEGPVAGARGRTHPCRGPSLAAALRRLGARAGGVRRSAACSPPRAPSGRALARALGTDPRVAYVERDRDLRVAVDPFDTVDVTPGGSGIKYTWAYDEVGPRQPLPLPAAARAAAWPSWTPART